MQPVSSFSSRAWKPDAAAEASFAIIECKLLRFYVKMHEMSEDSNETTPTLCQQSTP